MTRRITWTDVSYFAVIGVLTLTPYSYWKQTHAIHHSTSTVAVTCVVPKKNWGA